MKMLSVIKRLFFFWGIIHIGSSSVWAQTGLVDRYLEETKDYARIYSGEGETNYNSFFYENVPYYLSNEYVAGEIIYQGNYYPNQKMRLDLFKDELIILNPRSLGVILDPGRLNEAKIHGKTIIYHTPPVKSGLKAGYYLRLYDGKDLKLLGRVSAMTEHLKDRTMQQFKFNYRYYVLMNETYYPVRNRKSFSKIFPAYKKQIKKFTKERGLSFSADQREKSLAELTQFCESINQQR